MQELINLGICVLLMAAGFALGVVCFWGCNKPSNALWTSESEAERWQDCAGLQAESEEAQKIRMLRHYSDAQNFTTGPEYYAQMQNACNQTSGDYFQSAEYLAGANNAFKPVHGDPLPEEEESDREEEIRRK